MYTLYTEIEMPLIYSLYHMEKEGIQVQREKLKEYGDKLKVGIARLEKEIYEDTGREFNINSPKQLGEILFGEMKLRVEKRQRRAILRRQMCWKSWRQTIRWCRKSWITASLPS